MSSDLREIVMGEAQHLFDAVGINTAEDGNWLLLGLLTTPERNLDVFLKRDNGSIDYFSGFEKHARPRLIQLIDYLRRKAIDAEVYGPCGYPRGHDVNLKQQAVAAGIGNWGRNSLILHPEFGPNLRFMLVKTRGTQLLPTGTDKVTYQLSLFCNSCDACQQACPLGIISDGLLTDRSACLANGENMTGNKKLSWCRLCIDNCP